MKTEKEFNILQDAFQKLAHKRDDLILKHSLLQAEMKSWRDKEKARSKETYADCKALLELLKII